MARFATPDLEEDVLQNLLKGFASEDSWPQGVMFSPEQMRDLLSLKGAPAVSGKAASTIAKDVRGQMFLKDLPRGSELAKWVAGSKLSKGERAAATMGLSEGAREALMALVSRRSPDRVPARVLKERLGKLLQDINAGAEARVAEGPRPTMSVQRGEKKPQPWMRERYTPGGRGALAVPPQEGPLPSFKGGKVRPKAVDIYEQRALQRELLKELQGRAGGAPLVPAAKDLFAEPSTGGTAKEVSDYLAGLSPKERLGFIQDLKKKDQLAGRPTRAPYIRRELPERPDFELSAVQKEVQDRVREFKKITDEFDGMIPPGKLMAGIEPGPGRAKSIAAFAASQKKYNEAIKALDATFAGESGGKTHAIANKFILEIVKERPDLNAEGVRKLMPNLWSRIEHPAKGETLAQAVVKRAANFASERAAEATGKGERLYQMQPRRRGSELTSVAGSSKERPIPEGNNPMGWEREGDRAFMADKVEEVRQSLRQGKPQLEVLPHGEAPPEVHPQLKKVLDEQARLKTILPSGADDLDAYNAALYEAQFAGPDATNVDVPSPPKPKYTPDELKMTPRMKEIRGRAKMVEWRRKVQEAAEKQAALEKNAFTNPINHDVEARQNPTFRQVAMGANSEDVDLTSDFGTSSERDKAAQIENATGRKAQKAAERELSPRVPEGVRVASELRAGQGGLPPSGPKELEKIAELAQARIPAFKNLDLATIKQILDGKSLKGAAPEVKQVWQDVMQLATRRDAGVTKELGRAAWGIAKGDPEATVGMAAHVQKILKMLVTKL